MTEYEILRNTLQNLGAVLTEEKLYPDSFDSAYGDFTAKDGSSFRLVWDGTQGCGYLQSMTAEKLWKDLSPMVLDVSDDNEERMVKWLKLARKLTKGAAKPRKTIVKKVANKEVASQQDAKDIKIVKKRANGPFVKVKIADL